jgi:hypothetical protein
MVQNMVQMSRANLEQSVLIIPEGEYKEDGTPAKVPLRNGDGKMMIPSQWTYQGQWADDSMSGKGITGLSFLFKFYLQGLFFQICNRKD